MKSSRPLEPCDEEGISLLTRCIEKLSNLVGGCMPRHIVSVMVQLAKIMEQLGCSTYGTICIYCLLKLLLEATIQYIYISSMKIEDPIIYVRKRSRNYASFSATMIKRLRNVHGSKKKWILKTYLQVSKFVHPSDVVWTSTIYLDVKLVREVLDVILYVIAHAVRSGVLDKVCANLDFLKGLAKECELNESLKLLSR